MMEFLVRINYKSGHSYEEWFTKFSGDLNDNAELTSITWKLSPRAKTEPILLGLNNVESVIQLKTREVK